MARETDFITERLDAGNIPTFFDSQSEYLVPIADQVRRNMDELTRKVLMYK